MVSWLFVLIKKKISPIDVCLVFFRGLLHNETAYPEPHEFKPERFLLSGALNPEVMDPTELVFGFGRRICPGRHLAEASYWTVASSLIATFDISKALDADGKEINIPLEFTHGFVRHPKPFKCSIKARSPEITWSCESRTSLVLIKVSAWTFFFSYQPTTASFFFSLYYKW